MESVSRDIAEQNFHPVLTDEVMDQLTDLLGRQHTVVMGLLDSAQEKNRALLANALEALEEATAKEAALLDEFALIEGQRVELLRGICLGLKSQGIEVLPHTACTLEDLAGYASKSGQMKMLAQGEQLKESLVSLQELNLLNADLLRHSMLLANFSLSILTGAQGQVIYGEPGKKEKANYQKGRLDARV